MLTNVYQPNVQNEETYNRVSKKALLFFPSTDNLAGIALAEDLLDVYKRQIQTRSRFGSEPEVLNLATYVYSPDHSTIGTISHFDVLYLLVSTEFQVLFHSPPGVLFTFPSQYFSLSVIR